MLIRLCCNGPGGCCVIIIIVWNVFNLKVKLQVKFIEIGSSIFAGIAHLEAIASGWAASAHSVGGEQAFNFFQEFLLMLDITFFYGVTYFINIYLCFWTGPSRI